jgi:[NiFe] hydrogenase diaphorase moiety large subunit
MANGATWFAEIGSKGSPSTKLLSVSGDCAAPGVYEFPFGVKVKDLLEEVGAQNAQAVLIGGPSGQFISPAECSRTICYDDLATGGAVVVFGPDRDLLEIVKEYMEFFIDENCGYCTPCRAGNVLLKKRLEKIIAGKGEPSDLNYLEELGQTVKLTSRCGLGQTSANPILSTLKFFRSVYEQKLRPQDEPLRPDFDIAQALADAEDAAARKSLIFKT